MSLFFYVLAIIQPCKKPAFSWLAPFSWLVEAPNVIVSCELIECELYQLEVELAD